MLMGWGGVGWGWVGCVVCEGWLVFSKATCFPANHMTNHCCLSSRCLLLKILACDKTISLLMMMGWGGVGMGWVVCEGVACFFKGYLFSRKTTWHIIAVFPAAIYF